MIRIVKRLSTVLPPLPSAFVSNATFGRYRSLCRRLPLPCGDCELRKNNNYDRTLDVVVIIIIIGIGITPTVSYTRFNKIKHAREMLIYTSILTRLCVGRGARV